MTGDDIEGNFQKHINFFRNVLCMYMAIKQNKMKNYKNPTRWVK